MSTHLGLLSSVFLVAVFHLSSLGCEAGKILVIPLEGSHWVNMDILIRALHEQGHSITVVGTTKSWYIKEDSNYYETITVPVSSGFNEEFVKPILKKLLDIERGQSTIMNFINLQTEIFSLIPKSVDLVCEMATNMFEDKAMMKRLNESQYDLVLTDPAWGAGTILAYHLQLPLVYNVRWITTGEGHLTFAPSPISYIPMMGTGHSHKMTFFERFKNMLFYLLLMTQNIFMIKPPYQAVCDKYLSPSVDFFELQQRADIWLMRVDFVFEFPRPTMPNVVYMGGFQCKPAKPLPQDLEDFVQSSGEHGVVVMSLGTLVSELPHRIIEEIAAAFAKLPQKVIMRYTGQRPTTLGNNTLLAEWLPQNDLLGHPKTRLFIAHGGTNGVQEALYHGIPILGVPLMFDQPDNLSKMRAKGTAKVLDIFSNDRHSFFKAMQEVLHEPSYRENMQRLSRLHRDTPMKPLDSAIFWIEFVMRHKGAAHLRTESYKMPWYSYHSIDVMLFLFALLAMFIALFLLTMKLICNRICGRHKSKQE